MMTEFGRVGVADQALAVPVEPVARLDPSGFDPSRYGSAEEALKDLLMTPYPPVYDEDDTLGAMVDNQAWIVLSHVASFIGHRDGAPDLMEQWQEAWAEGVIQEGYFSPHRGVAAWIAKHCQLIPAIAIEADRPGREAGPVRKHESAVPQAIAKDEGHD